MPKYLVHLAICGELSLVHKECFVVDSILVDFFKYYNNISIFNRREYISDDIDYGEEIEINYLDSIKIDTGNREMSKILNGDNKDLKKLVRLVCRAADNDEFGWLPDPQTRNKETENNFRNSKAINKFLTKK